MGSRKGKTYLWHYTTIWVSLPKYWTSVPHRAHGRESHRSLLKYKRQECWDPRRWVSRVYLLRRRSPVSLKVTSNSTLTEDPWSRRARFPGRPLFLSMIGSSRLTGTSSPPPSRRHCFTPILPRWTSGESWGDRSNCRLPGPYRPHSRTRLSPRVLSLTESPLSDTIQCTIGGPGSFHDRLRLSLGLTSNLLPLLRNPSVLWSTSPLVTSSKVFGRRRCKGGPSCPRDRRTSSTRVLCSISSFRFVVLLCHTTCVPTWRV